MPKTRQQKIAILNDIGSQFDNALSIVVAQFTATPLSVIENLRRKMRAEGVDMTVVKKTLMKRLFAGKNVADLNVDDATGTLMVAFGRTDAIAPAKTVQAFAKQNENVKILGGILEEQVLAAHQVIELALLPTKEELIAKTVGTIKAPLSEFVRVLAGNVRGLVTVLQAIQNVKN
ncbi:MAG TPA: 50S ribosomal protein L10 [Patescibacteria group bacterium]|nr:50S ribosomal protein L10 [Patescibacteria group bacterium]